VEIFPRDQQTPEALGAGESRHREMVADHQQTWDQGFEKGDCRFGSKPVQLFNGRLSAFASCGHGAAWTWTEMGQQRTHGLSGRAGNAT
jgi:hypothetical protein